MLKNIWRRKKKPSKLPILGVEASGKTCFLWGLGHFLAEKGWGEADDAARDYFLRISPYMLKDEPIPASIGKSALRFKIKNAPVDETEEPYPLPEPGLAISTYDIAGENFREAMNVFSTAAMDPKRNGSVREFLSLIEYSEGLIVVVDLARKVTTSEEFEALSEEKQRTHMLSALGDQIVPLCRGVEYAIRMNKGMSKKPIFFVFTKTDIHKRTVQSVRRTISAAYAPLFNKLQSEGVLIKVYCAAYSGCLMQADGTVQYGIEGAKGFLMDLVDIFVYNERDPMAYMES